MRSLAPYQNKCVKDLHSLFKTEKSVCLAWYTGAGKTEVFIDYIKLRLKENPDLKVGISSFLTLEIKDQIYSRLLANNLGDKTHKIESGIEKIWGKNITVFNPQGIYRSMPERFKFDFMVIDEAHAGINHDKTMINKIKNKLLKKGGQTLLVSATPWDALQREEYKNITVLKRPLSDGIEDKRISDFRIFKEQAEIEFDPDDFTRVGDLSKSAAKRRIAILKAACMGKMKNIISKHDLGGKTIVVCPPGNSGEIARALAKEFNGLAFLQGHYGRTEAHEQRIEETKENLDKFKNDPKVKILFVIYKCQVGFDMPELTTVVDLSMTRNIKVLVQRLGRVARLDKQKQKKYFYVFDKSLGPDKIDWLLYTVIDFSLGSFDGFVTKTAKYRKTSVPGYTGYKDSLLLTDIVKQLTSKNAITTSRILCFDFGRQPPKHRTIEEAIEEAAQYKDRHDLFKKNPALYKFFRTRGHIEELNKVHPLIHRKPIRWTEERVIEVMKECKNRDEFNTKYEYARLWVNKNNRKDLVTKYLPPSQSAAKWNRDAIMAVLPTLRVWSDIRKHGNARRWLQDNNLEQVFRKLWEAKFKDKK